MHCHSEWMRFVAIAMAAIMSMQVLTVPTASAGLPAQAYAEERKAGCTDCSEQRKRESALCAFQYLIFFFWYASMVISFVVVFVMDIATGFSQNFTKSFIEWFRDSDSALKKYFRKLGC